MTPDQTDFSAALLNPDLPMPMGIVNPDGQPDTKRFNIYRNNVITSLTEAMETAFPAVQKLVGAEFFTAMAGVYVRANPPQNPLLMFYGETFPAFLKGFEPVQKLLYLADVAQLELIRRQSYHAKDADPIDPSDLAEIDPEVLMASSLTLAPSLYLFTSAHPAHAIWAMNMEDAAEDILPGTEYTLITRPELDVVAVNIQAAEHSFLQSLQQGQPLQSAVENAELHDQDFDLNSAFTRLLQLNLITHIASQGETK